MCMYAGADSDASSDSAPEMRYASDESDSEDDVSPATKRKARRARKAQAGSDEGEDASPVARPKSHRRGAAAKMAEEVRHAHSRLFGIPDPASCIDDQCQARQCALGTSPLSEAPLTLPVNNA